MFTTERFAFMRIRSGIISMSAIRGLITKIGNDDNDDGVYLYYKETLDPDATILEHDWGTDSKSEEEDSITV